MRRVNESVRAVVADALGDLKDPRIGLVTVTGVHVTPDLGEARIFISVSESDISVYPSSYRRTAFGSLGWMATSATPRSR